MTFYSIPVTFVIFLNILAVTSLTSVWMWGRKSRQSGNNTVLKKHAWNFFSHIYFTVCICWFKYERQKQVIITEGGSVDLLNVVTENVCSHMMADPKRGNIFPSLSPHVGKLLLSSSMNQKCNQLFFSLMKLNIVFTASTSWFMSNLYRLVVKARWSL